MKGKFDFVTQFVSAVWYNIHKLSQYTEGCPSVILSNGQDEAL